MKLLRALRSVWQGQPDDAVLPPSVGEDRLVYAIGDIHGRADLLSILIDRIHSDARDRPGHDRLTLVLLGDLVDRGPSSRGVVEIAMALPETVPDVRFIMGNHEEMFLNAARGDTKAARYFLRYGGRETLMSYGLSEIDAEQIDEESSAAWMLQSIPRNHVDFISDFVPMVEIGDYLFVHAGINPDRSIEDQSPHDLRWIRAAFLESTNPLPKWVVYGHTISEAVTVAPWRIGIDTGAYATGVLTAVGLQGTNRWFLSTAE